jgi:hypothetical protein
VSYPARKVEETDADQSRDDGVEDDGKRVVGRAKVDGFSAEKVAPWFAGGDELDDGECWSVGRVELS